MESKPRRRWRDVVLLVSIGLGLIVPRYYGKAEFAMALFVAAVVCACLPWQAFLGHPSDWTPYNRWVLRIIAAGVGIWLFLATPLKDGPFAAVILYAGVYATGERLVWRRMAAGQDGDGHLAT